MVREMARKTAEKMSDHSVIESKATHIYAYGLELLFTLLREIRETYKKINLITVQMPEVPSGICR